MYKIGNHYYEIDGLDALSVPDNFNLFSVEQAEASPTFHYQIHPTDALCIPANETIFEKQDIVVFCKDHLESRLLLLPKDQTPYAFYTEIDDTHSVISVQTAFAHQLTLDTLFHSLFAFERRAMEQNSFLLHSCFVKYNNMGILFTGPSGVGKSTQASLWKKYRDATIVNGDRTLITKEASHYIANPWPVCGSSQICINETAPLGCIVYLSQGTHDEATVLDAKQATKKILSETTINYWNRDFVNRAYDFISELICDIPVIHLTCTISEDAISTLEHLLLERNILS